MVGAGNAKFLEQLGRARVASLCSCGCASIGFAVSGKRPGYLTMRTLSDYQWVDDHGHLFGAYVFERNGLLAGLDLWSIDGLSTPAAMPAIARLVPLSAAQV